jgi:hypothetical protein
MLMQYLQCFRAPTCADDLPPRKPELLVKLLLNLGVWTNYEYFNRKPIFSTLELSYGIAHRIFSRPTWVKRLIESHESILRHGSN